MGFQKMLQIAYLGSLAETRYHAWLSRVQGTNPPSGVAANAKGKRCHEEAIATRHPAERSSEAGQGRLTRVCEHDVQDQHDFQKIK